MEIQVKRAYAPPDKGDGARVLVDRVWPRGVNKAQLKLNAWMKELAPSTALRKWFGHAPEKRPEFKRQYFKELNGSLESAKQLAALAGQNRLTLVYGAKDERHNNAVALKEFLLRL